MARSKPTDATAPSGKAGRGPPAAAGRGRRARAAGAGGKRDRKLGKDGQPKVGRLTKLTNQAGMIGQAYTLTRKNDPKLPWVMLIAFVVVAAVVELVGILLGSPFLFLPLAVLLGLLAALVVFGRRAQGTAYRQVEGQPGAAAWVLEGMRGDWRVTSGVAGTAQLDAVHRVLGRPGIVLVGRGRPAAGARPARPGEEEGRPGRRRHPDLRHHGRRRRGPGPAAQAQRARHEAAAQPHPPPRSTPSASG